MDYEKKKAKLYDLIRTFGHKGIIEYLHHYDIVTNDTNETVGYLVAIKGPALLVRLLTFLTERHGPNAKRSNKYYFDENGHLKEF